MIQEYIVHDTTSGVLIRIPSLNKELFFPNITKQDMDTGLLAYAGGALIQNAFPFLTPDQREFLMTGITPDEWDDLFSEDSDD